MARRSGVKIRKPHDRRYCKGVVYAPGGHGKTTLLGTAQEDDRTYPMLMVDWDAGSESLDGLDVDIAEVNSWRDVDEVLELLNSDSAENDYGSVGIDSCSEWHKWALYTHLEKVSKGRKEPNLLEQGDYGIGTTLMRRYLRRFRDLDMHVFYAAHAMTIEEPRTGRITVPDMVGKMSNDLVQMVSVCGYLAMSEDEDGEDERVLLMRNYPKFRIKARTPWGLKIPDEIYDPTITEILDTLGYKK